MKRIIVILGMIGIIGGCSSTESKFNKIKIIESEPQFILEEVRDTEKTSKEIALFNSYNNLEVVLEDKVILSEKLL